MVSKTAKAVWLTVVVLVFLLGLFLLILFPFVVFPHLVKGQLKLQVNEDGQPDTITWYWSHLPANSYYNYYMWNVTNVDEAWIWGEKVAVNDVGPYAWKEWESKKTTFFDDKKHVYFENDKAWDYDQSASCSTCSYEDRIWMPNLALMATAGLMQQSIQNLTSTQKTLTSLGTLLLGAYPFINVNMADALFNGYNDPLIALMNSAAVKILQKITGQPVFGFPVPDIQNIGYFPLYNHTADVNYTVLTGHSDYNQIGAIQLWGNSSSLDWWDSDVANNITGTSDGSYWGGFIDKDTTLSTFQSFTCRHLEMNYDSDSSVDSISTHVYKIDAGTFDTSLVKNEGYVVQNTVNKNFFPEWARNHPANVFGNSPFPPGLIEQKCFPGQRQRLPFMALLSNPHFYGADPEVMSTVVGLNPQADKHNMGRFQIQPMVGSTLDAMLRMQFSVAMFNDENILTLSTLTNAIVPCFWLEVQITLKDYAKKYIRFNTKIVPTIAWIVGGALTLFSFAIGAGIIASFFRKNKRRY